MRISDWSSDVCSSDLLAADNGIDLRDLHSTEPTGTAGIYVDGEGRNSIVIGAGANAALSAGHVDAQLDAFNVAGVVLAQLESPTEAIAAALLAARARGATAPLNQAPANAQHRVDRTSTRLTSKH